MSKHKALVLPLYAIFTKVQTGYAATMQWLLVQERHLNPNNKDQTNAEIQSNVGGFDIHAAFHSNTYSSKHRTGL